MTHLPVASRYPHFLSTAAGKSPAVNVNPTLSTLLEDAIFPERSTKAYLPFRLIGYRPPLSGLYRSTGRFIHQYPAAATTTSAATIAICTGEIERVGALPPTTIGGAVDDAATLGLAIPNPFPSA